MITDFLASLEQSGLGTWVRESSSVWAYPTVLTLHTMGLGIVVGAACVVDFRLLGFSRKIPLRSLDSLFTMIWVAFAVNAATGVLLFIADATHKAGQRVFHIKLICIALALICTSRVRKAMNDALKEGEPDMMPSSVQRLAIVSLVLWTGAIIAGRLMAYL